MMCINFPITVRLLQNNERGFPLIFIITVVEYWFNARINGNDYLRFYVPLKNNSLKYGDVTIAGEGLQDLGLCSALRAFLYQRN
jgi:hypothetical protein